MVVSRKVESLHVCVYTSPDEMGGAAADAVGTAIRDAAASQAQVRMVFAAAPSQLAMLASLRTLPDIPWERITAFQMDEYLDLAAGTSSEFGHFLKTHLFGAVPLGKVELLSGAAADPVAECRRYAGLLNAAPIDIVCMGIGENGHIAFNDPPTADFQDPETVKVVELDAACRTQQVHDGGFASLDMVPRRALTLTIPALMSGKKVIAVVPGPRKARAVFDTLVGPYHRSCPASALRRHPAATVYLDKESASLLGWTS